MYVRGSTQDYDDWSAFGKGWSWFSMAPYFRKHESIEDNRSGEPGDFSFLNLTDASHGRSGPVSTSFNNWRNPLERYFIEAAKTACGISKSPADPWGGDHLGFFSSLLTVDRSKDKGTRSYAASAYWLPNSSRPNLKVLTEAFALNVLLKGNHAQGVRISHTDREYNVRATKEVLLCCGTYKSPQLLELSGIGNPSILGSAGITCVVPLPSVGENLQDHVLSAAVYELKEGTVSFDSLRKPEVLQHHLDLYDKENRGILAAGTGCMGFLPYSSLVSAHELNTTCEKIQRSPKSTPFQQRQLEQVVSHLRSSSSANLQFILFQGSMNIDEVIQDQGKFAKPGSPTDPDGFTIVTCLQYPSSRGTVHITSSDPAKNPAIDPAYLTNPADVDVLAAGMELCDKIVGTAPLKDKIQRRMHPAPTVQLGDRQQARAVVRDFCMTEYHPCGTCAIGQVVDERLRVNGVKGLRVVDASVFPGNVSGNILSSVYAVAERAADMIKEDGTGAKASL